MRLPLHQIQRKPFVVQQNFDCNPQIQQEDPVNWPNMNIKNNISLTTTNEQNKEKKYIM
jgi:hypothetical protein